VFIMPRPIYIYVHKIVLQFYVCFCAFISHVVGYLFPVSPLVRVVQSCHKQICLRYMQLMRGLLVIFLLGVYCY
jgi:hypothetical protein